MSRRSLLAQRNTMYRPAWAPQAGVPELRRTAPRRSTGRGAPPARHEPSSSHSGGSAAEPTKVGRGFWSDRRLFRSHTGNGEESSPRARRMMRPASVDQADRSGRPPVGDRGDGSVGSALTRTRDRTGAVGSAGAADSSSASPLRFWGGEVYLVYDHGQISSTHRAPKSWSRHRAGQAHPCRSVRHGAPSSRSATHVPPRQ